VKTYSFKLELWTAEEIIPDIVVNIPPRFVSDLENINVEVGKTKTYVLPDMVDEEGDKIEISIEGQHDEFSFVEVNQGYRSLILTPILPDKGIHFATIVLADYRGQTEYKMMITVYEVKNTNEIKIPPFNWNFESVSFYDGLVIEFEEEIVDPNADQISKTSISLEILEEGWVCTWNPTSLTSKEILLQV